MVLWKMRILTWKNCCLRKYQWRMALLEILLPLAIIFLASRCTQIVGNSKTTAQNAAISKIYTKDDILKFAGKGPIYFTPYTKFTSEMMTRVAATLNIKVELVLEEPTMEMYIRGHFRNYTDARTDIWGVVFTNVSSDGTIPRKLFYEIKNSNHWSTEDLYTTNDQRRTDFEDPYLTKGFCAIQVALDDAFIKIKTEKDECKAEFLIQSFPYPEYTADDNPRSITSYAACLVVIIAAYISSISLMKDVIEEKENETKELLKIFGIDECEIWFCWFLHSFTVSAITSILMSILLKYPLNGVNSEAIYYTDFVVLLIIILFYCTANITFSFIFCSIFNCPAVASSVFTLLLSLIILGVTQIAETSFPILREIICLFPIGALAQAFMKINYFETRGAYLDWGNVNSSGNSNPLSLIFLMYMLIFDTFLYFFLTLIISLFKSGRYRITPIQLFKKRLLLWRCKQTNTFSMEDPEPNELYEKISPQRTFTLQARNVCTDFNSVQLLQNLNLDICEGEITVFLGQNGAGKTSTMAALTGMMLPSSGSVYYKGENILSNWIKFRNSMGVCPQKNILFSYLSVMDHLLLFGLLRGSSIQEARKEAEENIKYMDMCEVKSTICKNLSSGMKRKLCFLMALTGKPELLVLDEPTSGMDIESRKKLWSLLLELKENRTIILSTHYTEETELLADRIAFVNRGMVACFGSAQFLKKISDTGYELSIKKSNPDVAKTIEGLMLESIPETILLSENDTSIVYHLPLTETFKFPALFAQLETRKQELGIERIDVTSTTLEQLFWKVEGLPLPSLPKSMNKDLANGNSNSVSKEYVHKRKTGPSLWKEQIKALLRKKTIYTWKDVFKALFRISLPSFLLILFISGMEKFDRAENEPALDLNLKMYPNSLAVMRRTKDTNGEMYDTYARILRRDDISIQSFNENDIVQGLLSYSRENLISFREDLLLGVETNTTTNLVMYNPSHTHSLPIAINTFANVYHKSIFKNRRPAIAVTNQPVTIVKGSCDPSNISDQFYASWFFVLAFYTIDLTLYYATFQSTENSSGFKHMQFISDLSPFVYYLSHFLFDYLSFIGIVLGRIVSFQMTDHSYHFLAINSNLGALILLILLYGISGILFVYVLCYFVNSQNESYLVLSILNVSCGVFATLFYFLQINFALYEFSLINVEAALLYIGKCIVLVIPPLNFSFTFIKFMNLWKHNGSCLICPKSNRAACEEQLKKLPYFVFASEQNPNGILLEVIFLGIDTVILLVLLFLLNSSRIRKICNNVSKLFCCGTYGTVDDDSDMLSEVKMVQNGKAHTENTLVVSGLRKQLRSGFKTAIPVANVSFKVQSGECFGLLGVNGAGKTTTFRMLANQILPTSGDVFVEYTKLSKNRRQYLSMIGYCDERNTLLDELTGRQLLLLIATLRGVDCKHVANEVDKWICLLGLERVQNNMCSSYGDGNKRKICAAVAFITDPRVVFLDEPTTGLDPVSARRICNVINRSKTSEQAVVLSTHSMKENEFVCDRVTVLEAGKMKCLSTVPNLEEPYVLGVSLYIKLCCTPGTENQMQLLKGDMLKIFTPEYCSLKSQHKNWLLCYHITDKSIYREDKSIFWSELFERIEMLKRSHSVIVDVTICDIKLSDIYFSLYCK